MRTLKTTAIGLITFCGIILLPGITFGDDFQIRPDITVRGEYSDNVFFSANSSDAVDDYTLTIRPGIVLTDRTERLNARLSAHVAPFFYMDNSDLDDIDQDYRGRIGYQFTPRFFGNADAFYIVDHRIDRDLVATGFLQNADRRDRYHVGGGLGYNLSEVTSADVSYDFNRDDWERQAFREDVDYSTVRLGIDHNLARWLRATTGRLGFDYNDINRDSSETDSFAGTVAIRYRMSELFDLRLRGGARYASSDFDVVLGIDPATGERIIEQESNSGWGWVGATILGYRGEKTRGDLLFSRDLSPGSGRGTPTVLTRAVGSARYRITQDLSLGLRAGVYRNEANSGDFGTQEIDQYTYRIRPGIRWDFYDNFSLAAAYSYTYLDNKVTDRNTNRNTVFLQVSYGLPLFDILDLSGSELRQVVSEAVPLPEPQ